MTLAMDAVGWGGAAALLLAYGLVSASGDAVSGLRYHLLNLAGAAGLLLNGVFHGAWPSAGLNTVWLAIGLAALARRPRTPRPVDPTVPR